MIEQQASVKQVKDHYALIEIARKSACGHCETKASCGTSVLGKWLGSKSSQVWIESTYPLQPGERVIIGIEDSALLQASTATYLVPLLTLLAGAMIAAVAGANELFQGLFAAGGLVAGLLIVRWWSERGDQQRFQPQILRPLSMQRVQIEMIQNPKDERYE